VRFAGLAVENEVINAATYAELKRFLQEGLMTRFDLPTVTENCLRCAIAILRRDPDFVVDAIAPFVMNSLHCRTFDANSRIWHKVCKKVMTFHLAIGNVDASRAAKIIQCSMTDLGATEELIQRYFGVLGLERPRDRLFHCRQFFADLAKYRKSLGR
jgi:hypothetical protein